MLELLYSYTAFARSTGDSGISNSRVGNFPAKYVSSQVDEFYKAVTTGYFNARQTGASAAGGYRVFPENHPSGGLMGKLFKHLSSFVREESGQAITEYASVIAFTACIIALTFALAKGTLFSAVSESTSSMTGQLDRLNQANETGVP